MRLVYGRLQGMAVIADIAGIAGIACIASITGEASLSGWE
jgi:hypothetical protein